MNNRKTWAIIGLALIGCICIVLPPYKQTTRSLRLVPDPSSVTIKEKIKNSCKRTESERSFDRGVTKKPKKGPKTTFRDRYDESNTIGIDMVVSICGEDFLKVMEYARILKVDHVYIYSKCGQTIDTTEYGSFVDVIPLDNVGREGHTYLTHILRDDLNPARWTFFLQGEIERSLAKLMYGILVAHEHDEQDDNTDFINLNCNDLNSYRNVDISMVNVLNNKSEYTKREKKYIERNEMFYNRYKSNKAPYALKDGLKEWDLRGHFLMRDTLFESQNNERIRDLLKLLSQRNAPLEGHHLERLWVPILGATQNCRCEL